ncbi:hypothetical protein OSB04_001407 [Centaurea solstitialis]|uniref:Uncharacterized protein n=1 Tax=Centaurea solstitialis TaxID=347529 RepID=A0AA38U3J1_9ASTR|nr:hypothetical protein OSB04_001407 [Centaurea solstitialis]
MATQTIQLTVATHCSIKLTSVNFPVWCKQEESTLIGLELNVFIDGSREPPKKLINDKDGKKENPEYLLWYRQDLSSAQSLEVAFNSTPHLVCKDCPRSLGAVELKLHQCLKILSHLSESGLHVGCTVLVASEVQEGGRHLLLKPIKAASDATFKDICCSKGDAICCSNRLKQPQMLRLRTFAAQRGTPFVAQTD